MEKQNHPKYLKSRDRATGGKSKGQTRAVEASGINVKKPRQQQRQSAYGSPGTGLSGYTWDHTETQFLSEVGLHSREGMWKKQPDLTLL